MPSHTNSQQNSSPSGPRTPQNTYGGPPYNERYDSSPDTPPTTQLPDTSPYSPGDGAAVFYEASPGLVPDTPPVDQMTGRRGAIQADIPHERSFQDVDSYAVQNPYPEQTSAVPSGPANGSQPCPHNMVYPCFCRNITDRDGFVCRDCRFPICSFNRMLRMGNSETIRLELDREIGRDRQSHQFEFEIRSALEAARVREGQVRWARQTDGRNDNAQQ